MQTMKITARRRKLALFVAIIMALTLWTALPMQASAADVTGTDSATQLIYTVSAETNEATITGFAGDKGTVTTIEIPATVGSGIPVTDVGIHTFHRCIALTSITVATGQNNFSSEGGALFNKEKTILIRYPEGIAGSYSVPLTVTTIGERAFMNCVKLTGITITDNVTSISPDAFTDTLLTTLEIPANVTQISSFTGCVNLTAITVNKDNSAYCDVGGILFNKEMTTIEHYPEGKTDNSYTAMPQSVTDIGAFAFNGCKSLESVTIPNNVTNISTSAFEGCDLLESIALPEGLKSIGDWAFYNCSSLPAITIPKSVTSIGNNTFRATGLTSINITEGVKSIGMGMFRACNQLGSINIPSSVTDIGENAFQDCSNLTTVTGLAGVTSIFSSAFQNCAKLSSITLQEGLENIGDWAFYNCPLLQTVTLPKSLTSISSYAFRNTELTSIDIPKNVTNIGAQAFRDCSKLAEVTIWGTNPSFGTNVFQNTIQLGKVWLYNTNDNGKTAAGAKAAIMIEEITLGETVLNLVINGEINEDRDTLVPTVSSPAGAITGLESIPADVEWRPSLPGIATVNSTTGEVTAVSNGSTIITARVTTHSGEKTASRIVSVTTSGDTNRTLTVQGGKGSGSFAADATVSIIANDPDPGKAFDKWTGIDDSLFINGTTKNSSTAVFKMPAEDVTAIATYKNVYALTMVDGTDNTGASPYAAGDTVSITAGPAPSGQVFDTWTTSGGGGFANPNSSTTTFTMPDNPVTVTATYKTPTPPPTTYAVTVNNGTAGSAAYEAGATVTITANAASEGKVFDTWTTTDGVTFADANNAVTSFVMPAKAVTVTATYKDAPVNPPEPPVTDDGWVYESGVWKFFKDGEAVTGWIHDGKAWYYFASDGEMQTGWLYDHNDKAWYYLAGNGAMKTGWVRTDGSWYYLSGNGAMVAAKWLHDTDGSWYYLSGNGKMLTGKQSIGGKTYTFKANGAWVA
jgi:hypothetical protein